MEPFPMYKKQPPVQAVPDPVFSGIALNVQIPAEVTELLQAQHDQIQTLSGLIAQLSGQQQQTAQVLALLVEQLQAPRRRMKRTPYHAENGRIEYVIDEEM